MNKSYREPNYAKSSCSFLNHWGNICYLRRMRALCKHQPHNVQEAYGASSIYAPTEEINSKINGEFIVSLEKKKKKKRKAALET